MRCIIFPTEVVSVVEGKHIFNSIIAAIISTLIFIPFVFIVMGNINNLVREIVIVQLKSQNVPQDVINATLTQIEGTLKFIIPITPIAQILQASVLGAIMGLLYSYLITRRRLKPAISALITGMSYILIFYAIPMVFLLETQVAILNVIFKYIWWPLTIAPYITYTVILILFSVIKGPWNKWAEAKPSKY